MPSPLKHTVSEKAIQLGRAMADMRNQLRQFIQAKIRDNQFDLSFEMLEIMACLWDRDGINQQELADISIRDKSSMTYLIDNLVKRKLVTREADAADRRNKMIHLTGEGRAIRKKIKPWLIEMYDQATFNVAEDELEISIHLVKNMVRNLKSRPVKPKKIGK